MFNYFNKKYKIYPINNTIYHYTTIYNLDNKRNNQGWNKKKKIYIEDNKKYVKDYVMVK